MIHLAFEQSFDLPLCSPAAAHLSLRRAEGVIAAAESYLIRNQPTKNGFSPSSMGHLSPAHKCGGFPGSSTDKGSL